MFIVIRCDAGKTTGNGHLTRSLALADVLHKRGHRTALITSTLAHETSRKIKTNGHELIELEASYTGAFELEEIKRICQTGPVDWIVTDSYNLGIDWDHQVKKLAKSTLVIDDLANRPHACDLLLDQNILNGIQDRYKSLVDPNCRLLLGLDFLLAREIFFKKQLGKNRQGTLIFLGGGDNSTLLKKTMKDLEHVELPHPLKALITSNYESSNEIKGASCHTQGLQIYSNIDDPTDLYSNVKIAIVRCGFVAYELALLGVPMLIIFETEIQETVAKTLEGMGYGIAIPLEDLKNHIYVSEYINKLLTLNPTPMNSHLRNGSEVVAEIMELT
jgi:UDP-2,4-diacetamido-2,4,6-trideoxy-beta-L-altropyranose hydrolase